MTALGKLFRALPPRKANPEELIESYEIAFRGCTRHSIETVVIKLIRGELDGYDKRFAPSPPELSTALRDEMAYVRKQIDLAEERLQIADNRPKPMPHRTIWQRQAEAKQRMAAEGRALLKSDLAYTDVKAVMRGFPVGSTYVATLGAIYGPEGSAANADPVPEPAASDIPW